MVVKHKKAKLCIICDSFYTSKRKGLQFVTQKYCSPACYRVGKRKDRDTEALEQRNFGIIRRFKCRSLNNS